MKTKDAKMKEAVALANEVEDQIDAAEKANPRIPTPLNEAKIGFLMEHYKETILALYETSKALQLFGYERPWITVTEKAKASQISTVVITNQNASMDFEVEVQKKIRLEIR
jgi:hypothetical protein